MQDYLTPRVRRFSEHVADCFRRGDYAVAECFMGNSFIVNKARTQESEYKALGWARSAKNEDEWSLYLCSWFFGLYPRVSLRRGEERFNIRLTRHEHRGFAILFRAVFADLKNVAKQEKLQYKQKQELAYWKEEDEHFLAAN